jgi:hypothetical protein
MVGGEYTRLQTPLTNFLNWQGRITQDVRSVIQQQDTSTEGKAGTQLFRSRFMYRNATELGAGFRITATITGENTSVPRPNQPYAPSTNPSQLFVNTALLSYRARRTLEFSVGRDQLPTGVNIADLGTFVRARNNLGYYDSATQAKAFWWGERYLVSPYAYGPGGNEKTGWHESGGGVLAEYDVLGNHRTVIGANLLRGTAANATRSMVGPYLRLGFGKWGILAEHDVTDRQLKTGSLASFRQNATYGQLFWAAREWLVPSLIVERLEIGSPYREHLNAAKIELAARLTSQVTISAGPRIQRDELTGRISKSIVFQVALKTVH